MWKVFINTYYDGWKYYLGPCEFSGLFEGRGRSGKKERIAVGRKQNPGERGLTGFKSIRLFEFQFFLLVNLRFRLPPRCQPFRKNCHVCEILV